MRWVVYAAVAVAAILTVKFIHGKAFQTLVTPGPVAEAHTAYEKKCDACHVPFGKETQNTLCAACHKETGKDIQNRTGFHGRFSAARQGECKTCHTDHKGRDFDITGLVKESFTHEFTDFTLSGAHARPGVGCDVCHAPDNKFREAPADCFICHQKDDVHKGTLGAQCSRCHNAISWLETYFDHRQTRFPLKGRHEKLACDACHTDRTYKNAPVECAGCHLINDIHDSPLNEQCSRCHGEDGWKKISFDHNKETKFALEGGHIKAACDACHVGFLFKGKDPAAQCIDCHQGDDIHNGRYTVRCESCHVLTGWKEVRFDHTKDTRFQLKGAHSQVKCETCHKEAVSEIKLETSCVSCHKEDDIHKEKLETQCSRCHNENNWGERVVFDHDLTTFPLIGLHAVASCNECHSSPEFKDVGTDCLSCHGGDDAHRGTLGTICGECHNPNGWRLWEFDHDLQTKFSLEGAHAGLRCRECHTQPVNGQVKQRQECFECHAKDDVHQGRFGIQCALCHFDDSFKNIKRFHDMPETKNCFSCHEQDDMHDGHFGQQCGQCHVVEAFKTIIMKD